MGAAAEPHHPEARRGHGPSAGEHDPKDGEARRAGRGRHDVAGESREHPVRGGEEGAEEGRDAYQQQERARRGDQQGVAAGQRERSGLQSRGAGPAWSAERFSSNSTRIARPLTAMKKLSRKTLPYEPGATLSCTTASRGPASAPPVSSIRCSPKASPSRPGGA